MTQNSKMKISFKRAGNATALTAFFLLGGCFLTGTSKTPTEEAILNLTLGDFDKAVTYSQTALKDNPNDAYAMMVAGIAYDNLGYPHKSRRYYEDILASPGGETGMFGQFKNMQPQDLRAVAAHRLTLMDDKAHPYAHVEKETGRAVFSKTNDGKTYVIETGTELSPKGNESFVIQKEKINGGLDMLSEGDRNVVQRFLTFIRLRDEKLVTENEWQIRRAVNLGGLMPYSLAPAGAGLDLPSPEAEEIIRRLEALRTALELRSITPQEHTVEREIILEALLPSKPRSLATPAAPPKDILEGATLLRRLEMLQKAGLITPSEAAAERKVTENMLYAQLGMTGGRQATANASTCIQKCMKQTSDCPQAVPVKTPAKTPAKAPVKKAAVKKTVQKKPETACSCPVQ